MFEDFRLKVFMTVAREKSFTKAASELGVSQPAVSQNISELEKSAGVKLFDVQERIRAKAAELSAVKGLQDVKICPNCGTEIIGDMNFCGNCGTKLAE